MRDAKSAVFAAMRPLDPHSHVETFVALEAFVDDDRWQGMPFHLRTG